MITDISWIGRFTVSSERDALSNFAAASSIRFLTGILAAGKTSDFAYELSCFHRLGETVHMILLQPLLSFGKTGSFGADTVFLLSP